MTPVLSFGLRCSPIKSVRMLAFLQSKLFSTSITGSAVSPLESGGASAMKGPRDPNTLSNYHKFSTTHTSVDFKIDFEQKLLGGKITLKLKSLTDAETDEIILDTRYGDDV